MTDSLDLLRESVKERLSPQRYRHTLGVEATAERLGGILIPSMVRELRAAALLHDIAKEINAEEQLLLIKEANLKISDEDLDTPPALHSFAAIPIICRDFPEFATQEILTAVARHTLGHEQMSVFDKIIYISDYIEPTRTYESCRLVREYLFGELTIPSDNECMIRALNKAIVMSIDYTIQSVVEKGRAVNSTTIKTRKALLPFI